MPPSQPLAGALPSSKGWRGPKEPTDPPTGEKDRHQLKLTLWLFVTLWSTLIEKRLSPLRPPPPLLTVFPMRLLLSGFGIRSIYLLATALRRFKGMMLP